jgi:hypothetical protein
MYVKICVAQKKMVVCGHGFMYLAKLNELLLLVYFRVLQRYFAQFLQESERNYTTPRCQCDFGRTCSPEDNLHSSPFILHVWDIVTY